AAPGIRELRESIAEKSQKENGIPAKPENVIVAPTKHTLFMTFMALLESGDEALIPDPGWVSYAPMATLAGAKAVPIRAADEDGFVPSTEAVAEAITPRTRLIVLNSPSNPARDGTSCSENSRTSIDFPRTVRGARSTSSRASTSAWRAHRSRNGSSRRRTSR